MAIAPLENRLNALLPQQAAPDAPAADMPLEPMPAADQQPEEVSPIDGEPGTPTMTDSVQVAGPMGAVADLLRKTVTKQAPKAERALVPDAARAVEGELPDATKAGRYKLIPEADQKLTDTVTTAVKDRADAGGNIGKPSLTKAERDAGIPEEPFNLNRYATEDAAAVIGGVADALKIKTKAVTFAEIKAKAADSGISENFLTRLIGSDGKIMANAV
jgi:hypothetical protein